MIARLIIGIVGNVIDAMSGTGTVNVTIKLAVFLVNVAAGSDRFQDIHRMLW